MAAEGVSGFHTDQLFQFCVTGRELIGDGANQPILVAEVFPARVEAFRAVQLFRIAVIHPIAIEMDQRIIGIGHGKRETDCAVSIIKKGDCVGFT